MTDVYIITLSVIGIVISSVGMLVMLNVLLPRTVERAVYRLEQTPGSCFFFGGLVTLPLVLVIVGLLAVPVSAVKAIGGIVGIFALGIRAIGAAGMSRYVGQHFDNVSSDMGRTLRGALALTLGSFTPLVGWFLAIPLLSMMMFGAAVFAVLNWQPKEKAVPAQHQAATPLTVE